jgi:hypothetical protein
MPLHRPKVGRLPAIAASTFAGQKAIIDQRLGEVAEWLNAPHSKCDLILAVLLCGALRRLIFLAISRRNTSRHAGQLCGVVPGSVQPLVQDSELSSMAAKMLLPGFSDEPGRCGANADEWEQHLRMLLRLPVNTLLREEMIDRARRIIDQKMTRH